MHLLEQAAVFLLTAVLLVPLFQRLKLGAVLGYLGAGMLIGPWGLGMIGEVESTLQFAEFGVVSSLASSCSQAVSGYCAVRYSASAARRYLRLVRCSPLWASRSASRGRLRWSPVLGWRCPPPPSCSRRSRSASSSPRATGARHSRYSCSKTFRSFHCSPYCRCSAIPEPTPQEDGLRRRRPWRSSPWS